MPKHGEIKHTACDTYTVPACVIHFVHHWFLNSMFMSLLVPTGKTGAPHQSKDSESNYPLWEYSWDKDN